MKFTNVMILLAALSLGTVAFGQEPYTPTDAERARWTMGDMETLMVSINAYAIDYKAYPIASSVREIAAKLQPIYIRVVPIQDAWGTDFRIVSDGKHLMVISAGADRKFDDASWSSKARDLDYGADAVFNDAGRYRTWKFE